MIYSGIVSHACAVCQGDWVWLDVEQSDRSEYNVSVGAVIVSVDNSRIQLVDDDKQVCPVDVSSLSCHVTSHHRVMSCNVMSCHRVVSCHVMTCRVMSCHVVTFYHVVSCIIVHDAGRFNQLLLLLFLYVCIIVCPIAILCRGLVG